MKFLATLLPIALATGLAAQDLAPLRPPAVPLIAHDPYFSVWSTTDKLTDSVPTHWTGKPNSLSAAVRVDGKLYRVMGREQRQSAALDQTRRRGVAHPHHLRIHWRGREGWAYFFHARRCPTISTCSRGR